VQCESAGGVTSHGLVLLDKGVSVLENTARVQEERNGTWAACEVHVTYTRVTLLRYLLSVIGIKVDLGSKYVLCVCVCVCVLIGALEQVNRFLIEIRRNFMR